MAEFKIPVTWEVTSIITVEADSLEDAIKKFDEEELNGDGYDLPTDTEYVDGSFCRETDEEVISIINDNL